MQYRLDLKIIPKLALSNWMVIYSSKGNSSSIYYISFINHGT